MNIYHLFFGNSPWDDVLKMNSDLKKHAISCLAIILLGLFAYLGTLQAPFLYKDEQRVLEPPALNNSEASWIEKIFSQPILAASFSINRALSGTQVWGYHAVNLGIHLGVGLLFYFLVREWLLLAPPEQRAGLSRLPFFAAAIHVVHPINTQAVIYISDRSSLLVTFFYLAGLLCLLIFLNNQTAQPRRSRVAVALALIFFLLGCGTSAVAATLPIMAVIYLIYTTTRQERDGTLVIGILFPLIVYACLRILGMENPFSIAGQPAPLLGDRALYLMMQIKASVYYLLKFFLPLDLSFVPDVREISSLVDVQFICGVVAIGLGVLVFKNTKSALIKWALLWTAITHLPMSSLTPLDPVVTESRFYLPGLGLSFLLGLGLLRAVQKLGSTKPAIVNIGMAGLLVLLFVLTVDRGHDYRTPLALWQDTVMKSPSKVEVRVQLGSLYMQQEQFKKALNEFQQAIDRGTRSPEPYHQAGLAHLELREPKKALKRLQVAVRRQPESAAYRLALGQAYQQDRQYIESLKQLRLSRKIDPENAEAYNQLGKLHWDMKSYYFAEAAFQKAYQHAPESVDILNNLVSANMALHEYGEAIHYLKALQALNPDDANAVQMLIAAERLQAGQSDELSHPVARR